MLSQQKIIRFVITAFALYIAWFIIYDYFIEPDGRLNNWLNLILAQSGSLLLRLIGYNADVTLLGVGVLMRINEVTLLGVGNSCNGLELFVLFAGFIICFPGDFKNKMWFIPAGMLAIHLVNSLRAAALALNQFYHPQSLQFNHHYTFTMVVYAFIFFLWYLWVNRFAKLKKEIITY